MIFKYYEKPELFTGLQDEATPCDLCGEQKLCYDAENFFGTETISSICPECLGSGKLMGREISTCMGDSTELKSQLTALNPTLSKEAIESLVQEKTTELEKTTPHIISWQDWDWPCADGDYCRFVGFGSKKLYNRLAVTIQGIKMFSNSLYYSVRDESNAEELWEEALPSKEIADYAESAEFSILFYVFKSLHSDTFVTIWDEE